MSRVETIGNATIYLGDCLETIRTLPDCSVDSIVTDPPYGLGKEPDALAMLADWMATGHHDVKGSGFMGKDWDAFVPQPALWRECLRVLKPGGHLLAFAGTRTHDLMTLGLRIAGFEIRDTIMWVYGSGFPKSLDVSKAIDKAAGAEREVVSAHPNPAGNKAGGNSLNMSAVGMPAEAVITAPATDAARRWEGWGTALKPALEPITVARKPLAGTVAANVLAHGTGALNIDGCRVGDEVRYNAPAGNAKNPNTALGPAQNGGFGMKADSEGTTVAGRWPANLIHDGSDEVVALFPESKGQQGDVRGTEASRTGGEGTNCYGEYGRVASAKRGDTGSAARFFYCAKASKSDRGADNNHPTVKPTDLMRYLCRLVTPPGGVVLDPFMGSGSTGKGAMFEGFRFIGCELDPDYAAIARARIAATEQRVADDRRRIEDAQRQGRLIE